MAGLRAIGVKAVVPAVLALAFVGSSAPPASAEDVATLEAARGQVSVVRLGKTEAATAPMVLQSDDVIVTKRGRATVRFDSDGTTLRVGPDSRVQIDETSTQRDVTVFFGKLWAHVVRWKERTSRFATSSTIAAIRGTEVSFGVATDGDATQVAVIEGVVEAETDAGSLTLEAGQSATGRKGQKPTPGIRVKPQDAVEWALYYLPVLYSQPGDFGQGQDWQTKARESSEVFQKGDLGAALESVDGVAAEGITAPGFFTYRASLRLATGSVEDAEKDIAQALKLSANDSAALALNAIVAVARNENDKALATARQAVSSDPRSSTAQIALSYALQARFDLEGARQSLETAVALDPNDAIAWARLAEIRSSLGLGGQALQAAEKAASLQPNLSRAQTVLGFAHLTQVHVADALEAFGKAIALDQDDPLPRLGLGLAKIRDGDLHGGLADIEVAVGLDPARALVRSYLGKAYFEAKQAHLDEREYDVAEDADPNDPTSWFYDAIAQQTTNRPVEALQSLEKAIELNDNRAVYRSRLLLDSDLAARSASLGRIYNDLGFQVPGLVEGWKSVNTDPSNFSAHRLLADNYAALPRHEIARVSELFQSQMLQPLNTTPIQPSLGESNLFLISSQGPSILAFHEFNPLFNRDQVNVQGSFFVGEDDTLAGEGILSGIYKKLSFSAGYSGYKTDGFRENNNQDDKVANAFAQFEISPRTSVQAEVRYRKLETGDLGLHFFEDDYSALQSETTDGTNVRVGLRQDFGPGVTFLASYMHADKDIDFTLPDPEILQSFDLVRNEKSDSVEGQLLFRVPRVKVVAGGGYFDIDSTETTTFAIDDPIFGFTDIISGDSGIKHTNLYAYGYVDVADNLTLTVGASGDLFSETGEYFDDFRLPDFPPGDPVPVEPPPVLGDKDKFNPKAGVSWSLPSGTTVRGAWFRTLKRTLITDQTLEPTQVAGFNQFYDDPSATESEVWGAALDQKLGAKAFAGVQYTERDLTIPQLLLQDGIEWTVLEHPGDEKLTRAYLLGAPHPWFSLGIEYQYEQLNRSPDLFLSYSSAKTHRVPMSVRFFHPSGLGAFVGATYLKQKGEFRPAYGADFEPGDRSFWVVDLGVRYRLPKRYGFIVAGVNNLGDEQQTYEATDPRNLSIRPGRVIYGRVVLAFP